MKTRLQLAIQKKGRLSEKSTGLLARCGIEFENHSDKLLIACDSFPLDLLFLRDDDIPEYVQDGVADVGIVGENVIAEKNAVVRVVKKTGFGKCRLSIAGPEDEPIASPAELSGRRIATSYPVILGDFLKREGVSAEIVEISGSVEIAPAIRIAEYIFDIVSSGNTLRYNKLTEYIKVLDSEAVLIAGNNKPLSPEKEYILALLLERIESVMKASASRYIMMNAAKEKLGTVLAILPSMKSPTILPLADGTNVSVHAVIPAEQRWELVSSLKSAGATGILVLQIANVVP